MRTGMKTYGNCRSSMSKTFSELFSFRSSATNTDSSHAGARSCDRTTSSECISWPSITSPSTTTKQTRNCSRSSTSFLQMRFVIKNQYYQTYRFSHPLYSLKKERCLNSVEFVSPFANCTKFLNEFSSVPITRTQWLKIRDGKNTYRTC